MFAIYARQPNKADPLVGLSIGDRPEPEVPAGWVKVQIRAASLNMHDLWTLRGVGINAEQFPMILGCDGAGVLDDGREVIVHSVINAPDWHGDDTLDPQRTLLTEKYPGTFADWVAVPVRNVLPKPATLSFNQAATLGVSWLTAYRMLFVKSGLRPGQTLLIQGASGGLSTALIQLGRAAGFRVWVTGRSENKRAYAENLGAHRSFEPGVRLPERVDAVFESVGKETWSHSAKSVKSGGVIVTAGATTGDANAELAQIFFRQIRIVGSTMGTREEFSDLLNYLEVKGISPYIGTEIPFTQAAEGFRIMHDGAAMGKIVFTR